VRRNKFKNPPLKPLKTLNLKTAVAGLKMAHMVKITAAFNQLHHFGPPKLPFLG
jgi:hypothetical protein